MGKRHEREIENQNSSFDSNVLIPKCHRTNHYTCENGKDDGMGQSSVSEKAVVSDAQGKSNSVYIRQYRARRSQDPKSKRKNSGLKRAADYRGKNCMRKNRGHGKSFETETSSGP